VAVLDVPAAFLKTAENVKNGRFKAEIQRFGFNEGIVSVVWNDKLKSTLKPDTIAEAEKIEQQIRSGALNVPKGF